MKCLSTIFVTTISVLFSFQSLANDVEVIDKEINLTEDTTIEATSKISFRPNGKIITNGFNLRLKAPRIELESGSPGGHQPSIISFSPRKMQAGESGRNAGTIYILAKKVIGTTLLIKNNGESGEKGIKGKTGGKGETGRGGSGRNPQWLKGCIGRPGGTGGVGKVGHQGLRGGSAGDGGDVVLFIDIGRSNISIETISAGRPGDGGDGGNGGLGGDGGHPGSPSGGCGGTSGGHAGPMGPIGAKGDSGAKGENGVLHDLGLRKQIDKELKLLN